MSTEEEIRDVFERDVAEKSRSVVSKRGIQAFYGWDGFSVRDIFPEIETIEEEDSDV